MQTSGNRDRQLAFISVPNVFIIEHLPSQLEHYLKKGWLELNSEEPWREIATIYWQSILSTVSVSNPGTRVNNASVLKASILHFSADTGCEHQLGLEVLIECSFLTSVNSQGTEDIRSRINLARSAFSRLQTCYWSQREISLRTKGRVYQTVVRWFYSTVARHGLYE